MDGEGLLKWAGAAIGTLWLALGVLLRILYNGWNDRMTALTNRVHALEDDDSAARSEDLKALRSEVQAGLTHAEVERGKLYERLEAGRLETKSDHRELRKEVIDRFDRLETLIRQAMG